MVFATKWFSRLLYFRMHGETISKEKHFPKARHRSSLILINISETNVALRTSWISKQSLSGQPYSIKEYNRWLVGFWS